MDQLPEIITDNLILRRLEIRDLPCLVKYANNKKISIQVFNIPFPYTEADAINRMSVVLQGLQNKDRYIFAITLKGNPEVIGEIGLHLDKKHNHAQCGYWIAEPFWGKGIATEATTAALKFGFETLNLHKIYATHFTDNPNS